MSTFESRMAAAHAHVGDAQDKIDTLRNLTPFLIDLSLRENPVGARIGQTIADKMDILARMRAFGFSNILLGTLDYAYPDHLEVDDDFMMALRDHHVDMTGCFAFTQIGALDPTGGFTPDPSMTKLKDYRVPNTLHEIYLSDIGMKSVYGKVDIDALAANTQASIAWLNANIKGDNGGWPQIFINIVDGCDAFAENLERTCAFLDMLAEQEIVGISIEDDRGTYFPFQVGAFIRSAREFMPRPKKILVHMHAGGGFENGSLLEALACGADGAWGGLPKRAAIIGHASLGELIANLVRVENKSVVDTFQVDNLLPLATYLQILDEEQGVPADLPILGSNAYRLTLSFFEQLHGRYMDLPPESIGGKYGFRICPVVSDPPVIAGRLSEITGTPPMNYPQDLLEQMIFIMREDQRKGLRIIYDEPANLLDLLARAQAALGPEGAA